MTLPLRTRAAAVGAGFVAYMVALFPAAMIGTALELNPGVRGVINGVLVALVHFPVQRAYRRRAERRIENRRRTTSSASNLSPDDRAVLAREGLDYYDWKLRAYITTAGTVLTPESEQDRWRRQKREKAEQQSAAATAAQEGAESTDAYFSAQLQRAADRAAELHEKNEHLLEQVRRSEIEIRQGSVYVDGKHAGAATAGDFRLLRRDGAEGATSSPYRGTVPTLEEFARRQAAAEAYGTPEPKDPDHAAQDGDELAATLLGERIREQTAERYS